MKNTLIPLSSLAFVLAAAAAQASVFGTSSAITTATYTAAPSVTLSNLAGVEYYPFGSSIIDGGGAKGAISAATIHSFDGATFVMAAMTSATLPAGTPDYSQYLTSIGYQYDFDLTNASGADQPVSLNLTFQRNSLSSASGHVWTFSDPYGEYAEEFGYGGVEMTNGIPDGNYITTGSSTFDYYPLDHITDNPSYSGILSLKADYIVEAGATRHFAIWASAYSYVDFTPVPEPAALLPLGLGALAFLRRRRK